MDEQSIFQKLDKILSLLENLEKRVTILEQKKDPKNFLTCRYCNLKKEDVSLRRCLGNYNRCHYKIHSCDMCESMNIKKNVFCDHD